MKLKNFNKNRWAKPVFLILVLFLALGLSGQVNAFWQAGLLAKGTLVWWQDNKDDCSQNKISEPIDLTGAATGDPVIIIIDDNPTSGADPIILPEDNPADTLGTGDNNSTGQSNSASSTSPGTPENIPLPPEQNGANPLSDPELPSPSGNSGLDLPNTNSDENAAEPSNSTSTNSDIQQELSASNSEQQPLISNDTQETLSSDNLQKFAESNN